MTCFLWHPYFGDASERTICQNQSMMTVELGDTQQSTLHDFLISCGARCLCDHPPPKSCSSVRNGWRSLKDKIFFLEILVTRYPKGIGDSSTMLFWVRGSKKHISLKTLL